MRQHWLSFAWLPQMGLEKGRRRSISKLECIYIECILWGVSDFHPCTSAPPLVSRRVRFTSQCAASDQEFAFISMKVVFCIISLVTSMANIVLRSRHHALSTSAIGTRMQQECRGNALPLRGERLGNARHFAQNVLPAPRMRAFWNSPVGAKRQITRRAFGKL